MKLIGKLKLINLKTNKCEKIYDYESLRADLNEKIRVKQMIDSGKYKLLCGCNDHEMRIKNNIYHIYIYKQNTNHLHHHNCPKSREYEKWMKENIKGWLVNEDGEVRVNLDFSLNPKLFNKESYDVKFDKEYNVLNEQNFNKNEIALNKISILSLGTKLFLQTWEKAIREKKTIPILMRLKLLRLNLTYLIVLYHIYIPNNMVI